MPWAELCKAPTPCRCQLLPHGEKSYSFAGIPVAAQLQLRHKGNVNYLHYLPSKLASTAHEQP